MAKMLHDIPKFLFSIGKLRASSITGTNKNEKINISFAIHVEKNFDTMNYTYLNYEIDKWSIYRASMVLKVHPKFNGMPRH